MNRQCFLALIFFSFYYQNIKNSQNLNNHNLVSFDYSIFFLLLFYLLQNGIFFQELGIADVKDKLAKGKYQGSSA